MDPLQEIPDLYFEFIEPSPELEEIIATSFKSDEVMRSKSFLGKLTIGVLILSSVQLAIRTAFTVWQNHRKDLQSAKVRIGKEEVSFEGFSASEVKDMIESGNIDKVLDKLKKDE
ncbi:hypothetical protein [Hufsiella ginkgonis]|uniref:Uncharacterized protein n=1 Tax=Hufsiella ginkgonis TaxID=2695274 RepID=A0A7K1XU39_9SPHI|nr:hypothetical protein [Hufsiella ginkgonis]MXV14531.1 hypothetical protein [Hufsiella ginkgonis]